MGALKGVGSILLGIVGFLAVLWIGILLIHGVAWISISLFQYLTLFNHIVTVLCVLLFLPLGIFRKTRAVSAYALFVSSYAFGLCVWLYGFLVTYMIWGVIGVLIGIGLGIVGVVPLGIIAAALHSQWSLVAELVYGLVLTYGARLIALWLAAKVNSTEERIAV